MAMDLVQIIPTDHWEYVLHKKQTVDAMKLLPKTPDAAENLCVERSMFQNNDACELVTQI